MEKLKRKDILLVAILSLSCVFFAVSKPDTMDTREVVWNYSFMVVLFSTLFWFVSEMFSWVGDLFIPDNKTRTDVASMSKNGLIVMAEQEGISDRRTLEGLTEEDIIALLNNKAGKSGGLRNENVIIAIVMRIVFLIRNIMSRLRRILKNVVAFVNRYIGSGKKKKK
jgi:hypothetical protein